MLVDQITYFTILINALLHYTIYEEQSRFAGTPLVLSDVNYIQMICLDRSVAKFKSRMEWRREWLDKFILDNAKRIYIECLA